MKRILFVTLAFTAVIAFAIAAEIPADKEVITFESKIGTVTFEHKVHAGHEGVACVDCHHTTKEGETPESCSACHAPDIAEEGVPKLAGIKDNAGHMSCWGCHEDLTEAGKAAGPGSSPKECKDCHVRG